jgi:DNA repair protein RadD
MKFTPRPHQSKSDIEVWKKIDEKQSSICFASPCGSGKTISMAMILQEAAKRRWRASLYTHRRMLFDQTCESMEQFGLDFGRRAAGFEPDVDKPIQLHMVQTEVARSLKSTTGWGIHQAKIFLIDEAHAMQGKAISQIVDELKANGAHGVGFTATPVGLWSMFDELVTCSSYSELIRDGYLLPCHTYAPNEISTEGMGLNSTGEYSPEDLADRVKVPVIFGYVYEHWMQYNPSALPTILFAPNIKASMWFVDMFKSHGVSAAHIDGKYIYYGEKTEDGEKRLVDSTPENREILRQQSESGEIKVVSNRFVLREGISWNHLYHAILATVFGSLSAFIQAAGRILRSYKGLDHVVLQCHGGSPWRHGLVDQDREWEIGDTNKIIRDRIKRSLRQGEDDFLEPLSCIKCGRSYRAGDSCPSCGAFTSKRSRAVIQLDGTLERVWGQAIQPKPEKSPARKEWDSLYFSTAKARNSKRPMNWNAMVSLFKKKYPEFKVYQTIDNQARPRWAAFHGGSVTYLQTPPLHDKFLWECRVRDVPYKELMW